MSVVVVSYNTIDELRRCLCCIEVDHEVIVVDNGSSDGSPEMVEASFPSVRLIRNTTNEGFGAANNLGVGFATRKWVLFLNSDAYAKPGAIARIAIDAADSVAAGGRLLNLDGSLQQSVAGPLTLWNVFLEQSMLEKLFPTYWRTPTGNHVVAVYQVMGACLLARRELARFDERFFLYCEDTELCERLRPHGRIVYCPKAEFEHELGLSSKDRRWLAVARYNSGKELYFRIHRGPVSATICRILNRLGSALRLLVWIVLLVPTLGQTRPQVSLFWRVLTSKPQDIDPRGR